MPRSVVKSQIKYDTTTVPKLSTMTSIGFKKCPLLPNKLPVIAATTPMQLDNIIKKSSDDKEPYEAPKIHSI